MNDADRNFYSVMLGVLPLLTLTYSIQASRIPYRKDMHGMARLAAFISAMSLIACGGQLAADTAWEPVKLFIFSAFCLNAVVVGSAVNTQMQQRSIELAREREKEKKRKIYRADDDDD